MEAAYKEAEEAMRNNVGMDQINESLKSGFSSKERTEILRVARERLVADVSKKHVDAVELMHMSKKGGKHRRTRKSRKKMQKVFVPVAVVAVTPPAWIRKHSQRKTRKYTK